MNYLKSEPITNSPKQEQICSCYFCFEKFEFGEIEEFTKDKFIICPKCHVDSVIIGDIPKKDLKFLYNKWFKIIFQKF